MKQHSHLDKMLMRCLGDEIEISPLSSLISLIIDYRGMSPPKSENGIPLITARNVRSGYIDFSEAEYIHEREFEQWMSRGTPHSGDVLFTTEAPMGNAAMYPQSGNFALGQRVVCIRPRSDLLDGNYLKNYFISALGYHQLYLRSSGSTALGIKSSELRKVPVPLIPIDEQREISRIIILWDRIIDLTERLIAAKQERRTWLMQQLLTGKRRPPGFECSLERHKTPFGSLPADWAYPRIGEVAKQVSERNGDNTGRPVLSCTKHKGLVDSLAYFDKRIFSEDLSNYKVVRQGQFAYATNHIDEGSIGYQNTYDEALISPIYTVFQTNSTIDDRFLYLILKTETYRHIFASNTSASVDRRGSLRWSDFAKIHVPHPSIEEQRAIVAVFKIADCELDLLRAQLNALREQKKGLMQQLLTGKRRVKV
jgi:type I restriction enzyme, S subunit